MTSPDELGAASNQPEEKRIFERRLSDDLYRIITENAYDLVSIVDKESWTFVYASPSFERILGYTNEEIIGSDCFFMFYPDDIIKARNKLYLELDANDGSGAFRITKKDGTYIWLEINGVALKYRGKNHILFVSRDINSRMLAEIALRESEERYRLIVNSAYDGICIADIANLNIAFMNPALQKMLGIDLTGRSVFTAIHPDDRVEIQKSVMQGLAKGEGDVQCRVISADGTVMWWDITGKVMECQGDKQEAVFIIRDITRRKEYDDALKVSQQALQQSGQQLKDQVEYLNNLIENLNEIFITCDMNRRITSINQIGSRLLGYAPSELIGQDAMVLAPTSISQGNINKMTRCIIEGESMAQDMIFMSKRGNPLLVKVKSSPIIRNDVISGAMLLAEDITEYSKMQKEMARVDQMNTVGQMAASIGHEIRNPMTAVKGFLQIMSQNEDLAQYRTYFDVMLEELERANFIIGEFLSLAKDRVVVLQPQDLNSIINAISPLLCADASLAEKQIEVQLQDIPQLLADEKEMRQLLLNLVRNGLEATPVGGTVFVSTYQEDDKVFLSVRDEGSGIDSNVIDKLGTPFVTTKEKGTGLGLAICHSIAARHSAFIQHITGPQGTNILVSFNYLQNPQEIAQVDRNRMAGLNQMYIRG